MRVLGTTARSGQQIIPVGVNTILITADQTPNLDVILNGIFNLTDFVTFCQPQLRSCELNYCKTKIDELLTMIKTPEQQKRDYINKKMLYTLKYFKNKLLDGEFSGSYHSMKSEWNNATKIVKKKYNKLRFRMTFDRFYKIYRDIKDLGDDQIIEKLKDYNIRPISGSYLPNDFKQYKPAEAMKIVAEKYPLVVMKSNQKVSGLIKSRDQYLNFINNPPIVKTFTFKSIFEVEEVFRQWFRKSGRQPNDFYLFREEPLVLLKYIKEDAIEFDDLLVTSKYQSIYGRNYQKKLEEDTAKGFLTRDMALGTGRLTYFQNENTPDYILNYNDISMYATGQGVGLGMFFAQFGRFMLDRLTPKKLYLAKYIKLDYTSKLDIYVRTFEYYSYSEYLEEMKVISSFDWDLFYVNTRSSITGRELYSYMTGTHIGTTESFIKNDSVSMHGFSTYNLNVSTTQLIPFTAFKNNRNLLDYFASNKIKDVVSISDDYESKMLGYFLKKLPEHKFTFNTFDNYFCPITAINLQNKEVVPISNDQIIGIYFALGIFRRNDLRINKRELPSFYSEVFNLLGWNVKMNIYTCKDGKKSGRTYYFIGKEGYYAYSADKSKVAKQKFEDAKTKTFYNTKVFSVTLLKGHVFNTNERGSLKFLTDVSEIYDTLEDAPEIHIKMSQDIKMFIEIEQGKISEDKSYLLRHAHTKKNYKGEKVDKHGNVTLNSQEKLKYSDDDVSHYFDYDYETSNSSNKYSIKYDNHRDVDISNNIIEEGKLAHLSNVVPYSNMSIKFNPENGDILNKLFTYNPTPQTNTKCFINWLVDCAIAETTYTKIDDFPTPEQRELRKKEIIQKKKQLYFYIFAHNGSGFDNIILMYDVMRHIDFKTLNNNIHSIINLSKCDVAGRPLSFDFTIILSAKWNFRRVKLSFRDSYRILSTPVKDFGSTFGLDVVKLEYPYAFYQDKYGSEQKEFGKFKNSLEKVETVSEFIQLLCSDKVLQEDFRKHKLSGDLEEQFQSYKLIKIGMEEENTLVSWKSIGIDIDEIDSVDQLLATYKKSDLYTDEFIRTCYNIRTRKYDLITKNVDMIQSLEEYNNVLDEGAGNYYMFDYMKYCEVYNTYDCYNLVKAMVAFKDKIMEMANIKQQVKLFIDGQERIIDVDLAKVREINVFQQRSISGIAWLVAVKTGCLDGVVKLKGQTQEFISCDKRGGKCFVNRKLDSFKSKYYDELMSLVGQDVCDDKLESALCMLLEDSLVVNDFCSMYPAAMCLMGVPMGQPKPIYKGSEIAGLLANHKSFWVRASWTTKHMCDVPESSMKVDGKNSWTNGTFTNQVIDDPKIRYMTETTGELALSDIDFNSDSGYPIGVYFDDCNYNIAGLMKVLYDERTRVRYANPGLGNAIKLILNSIFGRSILKEKPSKNKFIKTSEINDEIAKNRYKMTDNFTQYGDYCEVNYHTKPTDHAIYPQFGVRCLSISKTMLGVQLYAVSNIEEKLKLVNQGYIPPSDPKEICKWTVETSKIVNGQPLIECSSCYNDTDSEYIPTQSLRLIKSFLGNDLGQLHSDFDFKGAINPLCKYYKGNKYGDLPKEMALSAIEAYYCAPKSYGCRVFGIDKNNKFAVMDSVKFKGVFKALTSLDKIKSLYNGNPVRFIDVDGVHFVHSKGNGLAAQQDVMCKEVMPFKLDTSKYYYAEGDTIFNGHYRFDEMPIQKNNFHMKNDRIDYYIYNGETKEFIGNEFSAFRTDYIIPEGYEYRYGELIICRLYKVDEPVEYNIRHQYYEQFKQDKRYITLTTNSIKKTRTI